MKIKNIIGHFKTVCTHKYWVYKYCSKVGLRWRGIIHDLSKFSPTEFFESAKYYTGTDSPINRCKKINGYSKAWLHHKGRNMHHYEYWQDNFDSGTTHLDMPFKYLLEMLCDYLGAARAYMGKDFSLDKEIEWWNKKSEKCAMSHNDKRFITLAFMFIKMDKKYFNKYVLFYIHTLVSYTDAYKTYQIIFMVKQMFN